MDQSIPVTLNQSLSLAAIQSVVDGRCTDPFAVLGPHTNGTKITVRSFQPGATRVSILSPTGKLLAEAEKLHPGGFFSAEFTARSERYKLKIIWPGAKAGVDDTEQITEDPYRFPLLLSDYDLYLLGQGTHEQIYEVLGAHPLTLGGVSGVRFAVWAPNAVRASVVGDFNFWDGRRHPMRRRENGYWELFIPGISQGAVYKYEFLDRQNRVLPQKADPFGLAAEHPPATASIVWNLPPVNLPTLNSQSVSDPVSIYEVHLGSWKRGENNRYLTYRELAADLVPYVRDMGFTHLELMPVHQYPFDGSWGYQPVGLYAPTSRFGTPDDFRAMIDASHAAGLKVLVDWVPGHFPDDAHGLVEFDGSHLYEHEDPRLGKHMDWNTLIYNFGRNEVFNFLLANALFWTERYSIDGLRVDAVASMLYRNYSRRDGEWLPNRWGSFENEEAVALFQRMNERFYARSPKAITIAEESTAWAKVSRPTDSGGLGFGYKWNMGWMHDTLSYMSRDPIYRKYHQNDLTFGLVYAFNENFILPLSHDEVVHGKKSLLGKMAGDEWQKFANLRAYLGFQFGHPGKKLLFMGNEFGQWKEWNHDYSLDWHLLQSHDDGCERHRGLQQLVRDLNQLYVNTPALYMLDCDPAGFEWIDYEDSEASVISFIRRSGRENEIALIVCNFTPVVRHDYRVGVPRAGWWEERINSDAVIYGGSNVGNGGGVASDPVAAHTRAQSLRLTLPPLAALIFTYRAS